MTRFDTWLFRGALVALMLLACWRGVVAYRGDAALGEVRATTAELRARYLRPTMETHGWVEAPAPGPHVTPIQFEYLRLVDPKPDQLRDAGLAGWELVSVAVWANNSERFYFTRVRE